MGTCRDGETRNGLGTHRHEDISGRGRNGLGTHRRAPLLGHRPYIIFSVFLGFVLFTLSLEYSFFCTPGEEEIPISTQGESQL